jgi:hypothetical protein
MLTSVPRGDPLGEARGAETPGVASLPFRENDVHACLLVSLWRALLVDVPLDVRGLLVSCGHRSSQPARHFPYQQVSLAVYTQTHSSLFTYTHTLSSTTVNTLSTLRDSIAKPTAARPSLTLDPASPHLPFPGSTKHEPDDLNRHISHRESACFLASSPILGAKMASSARSSVNSKRANSRPAPSSILRRQATQSQSKPPVSDNDAYTYALRVAFLAYLLQPRQKRVQHVANTSRPIQRSSTSINDMVKDFSLIRDSKSTKFPHAFMGALDKRMTKVLVGQEKMPEYSDALIKRTFAAFLNEFKNPTFRKSMEKDRKVEDLLLIFFSKATTELQKGKAPDDDSWKGMVDRHVALFVRLISSVLKTNDWSRERPELSSRLHTLETKLLQHDQDLADSNQRAGGQGGQSIEVEVPRSYEVRDMPLVIRVCRIFAVSTAQAQNDINMHKDQWTEKAALRDLKEYQNHLMLSTKATLTHEDFESDEAFDVWRKGEISDLSQMMLAIIQVNPELAKSSTGGAIPGFKPSASIQAETDSSDASRSQSIEGASSYVMDQPIDLSSLNLADSSPRDSRSASLDGTATNFTFIPTDPRAYYRQVLKVALTYDMADDDLEPPTDPDEAPVAKLLSPQSTELLNEIGLRWRTPHSTRLVLFLDVVKEKFIAQDTSLETLDAAFLFVKEPPPEPTKKGKPTVSMQTQANMLDRNLWTSADQSTWQRALSALHDALLRELFSAFVHCYGNKPPAIGSVLYVIDTHLYEDQLFSTTPEELDGFTASLIEALRQKARDKYGEILSKNVPEQAEEWEFAHVIKLGSAVVALCEKIQKRYRKNPEVMGANPLSILVEEILPSFADDARALVSRVMEMSKARGEEVPIQDGFDLYKELVQIRQVHAGALPGREFGFHIEGLLQDFVWRWIAATDSKMLDWIEGALAQDDFKVRTLHEGNVATDDERHSQSPIDVFRIFNQSIDQIVKLEWDDDLQYAKFMTATGKSIGAGVARYCELMERKFIAEMDRQTPEQEAAAQRTQKERWVAMARDAWNQKEKVEPFQFLPESLVKVNNVEYAMLQLDKLEHEINVDACAEVIQRREPPPPKMRGAKFVFTIKIIEAEDLKAGDMNGLSDPYVVLGDEYQKRLAKTKTIYANLNPRWDESIDIVTTGPLNIIATVWDWDALGDHDCLGRTSLKLDPAHFNDYMPREYWLDLDTQGRLLVRVSMEGERDDIQFYFGKAFRTLKRTERDMTRNITDKLSSYIHQCLSRRTLRALTAQNINVQVTAGLNSMKGYWSKVSGRPTSMAVVPTASTAPTQMDVNNALKPLLTYFDDNFAIMKQTLTDSAMVMVMTRLWKETLVTLESLLVPPLSDKVSSQRSLNSQEVDVVYKWLQVSQIQFRSIAPGLQITNNQLDPLRLLPRRRRRNQRSPRRAPRSPQIPQIPRPPEPQLLLLRNNRQPHPHLRIHGHRHRDSPTRSRRSSEPLLRSTDFRNTRQQHFRRAAQHPPLQEHHDEPEPRNNEAGERRETQGDPG